MPGPGLEENPGPSDLVPSITADSFVMGLRGCPGPGLGLAGFPELPGSPGRSLGRSGPKLAYGGAMSGLKELGPTVFSG